MRGANADDPLALHTVQMTLGKPFSYSHVPEDSIYGSTESGFQGTELQFHSYSCSFSGPIEIGTIQPAVVAGNVVEHVFVVTAEADPQLAYQTAKNGG